MDDRLFDPTPTLSVSEVLSRARVVVERAFKDGDVWIEGEIQSLKRTGAGSTSSCAGPGSATAWATACGCASAAR